MSADTTRKTLLRKKLYQSTGECQKLQKKIVQFECSQDALEKRLLTQEYRMEKANSEMSLMSSQVAETEALKLELAALETQCFEKQSECTKLQERVTELKDKVSSSRTRNINKKVKRRDEKLSLKDETLANLSREKELLIRITVNSTKRSNPSKL